MSESEPNRILGSAMHERAERAAMSQHEHQGYHPGMHGNRRHRLLLIAARNGDHDRQAGTMPTQCEQALGSLLGVAVGDALGAPVEFMAPGTFPPVTGMMACGRGSLPQGHWTDDTAMTLCLADSLLHCGGFDARDQMDRYLRWFDEGYNSSTGKVYGIGQATFKALQRYRKTNNPLAGETSPRSAGNGSLMRLAPIPIYYHDNLDNAAHYGGESSRTTHALQICVDACRFYAALIWHALQGASKEDIFAAAHRFFQKKSGESPDDALRSVAEGSFMRKEPPEITGAGYVISSLEAALWAFAKADTFAEGMLLAVNLGQDADTVGAIFGQLAGAFWGLPAIPSQWLDSLHKKDHISGIAVRLWQR